MSFGVKEKREKGQVWEKRWDGKGFKKGVGKG